MKRLKASALAVLALGICGANASENLVLGGKNINKEIGDKDLKLQVLSRSVLRQKSNANNILSITSPLTLRKLRSLPQGEKAAESIADPKQKMIKEDEKSLLIGLPIGLIGEQNVFGGVITKVTDKENDTLGSLKLTDLSPIHVRSLITGLDGANPAVTLVGCPSSCGENSQQLPLINFPIVGYNQETEMIIVDMAPIGKELDLISMLDPDGEYTQLKAESSSTTAVDYSTNTLVFDITTVMKPVMHGFKLQETVVPGRDTPVLLPQMTTVPDPDGPTTSFTVRWYLKMSSGFNPAFVSRSQTPGVGFFTTERGAETKITRFSTTNNGSSVKYYIKNVPEEYKKTFASALDNWNKEFKQQIGRNLLSYEFIDSTDPRSAELVAGDIRYNIIEWDLENIASYGGLGPSIANQYTGETISANVLIQGPTIISLYTQWFKVSREAEALEREGKDVEARKLIADFGKKTESTISKRKGEFKIKLGKSLEMTVQSQKSELEDPIIKTHFEKVPQGVSFEQYMAGYFTEMLEHEIGHNLGLRHNFKGNLGATDTGEQGSVSRSIMEYLGRGYRHLSGIGDYDKMAIAYGYKGVKPQNLDWFCTDEDKVTESNLKTASAECSQSDATSDPFSYWESRLERAIELLVDTKSTSAPVLEMKDYESQIDEMLNGFLSYGLSAQSTAETWTNFFNKEGRPERKEDVMSYVLQRFKFHVCGDVLDDIVYKKETKEARRLAQRNLNLLVAGFAKKTSKHKMYELDEFVCD
ncbi:MAG: zinc-dependent metalloprotease [Bacteriovoracaceae bacterium]